MVGFLYLLHTIYTFANHIKLALAHQLYPSIADFDVATKRVKQSNRAEYSQDDPWIAGLIGKKKEGQTEMLRQSQGFSSRGMALVHLERLLIADVREMERKKKLLDLKPDYDWKVHATGL